MRAAGVLKRVIIIQALLPLLVFGAPTVSIFAHYMPWFQTPGYSHTGWTHWGDTIPNQLSHYTPLIGLYDSRDPNVLEYQVLEMKYAGLDGLFMDWYGINNSLPEYGAQPIFQVLAKAGLKFGIVWEDRYAPSQGGATPVLQFIENNFFNTSNYVTISGHPVLLVWQVTYLDGNTWQSNLNSVSFKNKPILCTRDTALGPGAVGAFSWINAGGGTALAIPSLDNFLSHSYADMIPTAFPRFNDDYPGFSYGSIADQNGQMFMNTFNDCLTSGNSIIQIATWNDWQEGTIIEPSVEFQYRDLDSIQSMRKKYIDPSFSFTPADLLLPDRLFRARRQGTSSKAHLDSASNALFQGNPQLAQDILDNKTITGIRNGTRDILPVAREGFEVYDVLGRKIRSFNFPFSNAIAWKGVLKSGLYLIERNDESSARFLMQVH